MCVCPLEFREDRAVLEPGVFEYWRVSGEAGVRVGHHILLNDKRAQCWPRLELSTDGWIQKPT